MTITPDNTIYWEWGVLHLNATLAFTWVVMILLVGSSWLITRKLTIDAEIPRWQNLLEVLVTGIRDQTEEVSGEEATRYLSFITHYPRPTTRDSRLTTRDSRTTTQYFILSTQFALLHIHYSRLTSH